MMNHLEGIVVEGTAARNTAYENRTQKHATIIEFPHKTAQADFRIMQNEPQKMSSIQSTICLIVGTVISLFVILM